MRYSCSEGQNLEIVGGRAELLERNTHKIAAGSCVINATPKFMTTPPSSVNLDHQAFIGGQASISAILCGPPGV